MENENSKKFKTNFYYVGARSFNSKAGKTFNVVELIDVTKDGASAKTFFMDEFPELCEKAHLGDLVECLMSIEDMSRPPRLEALLRIVAQSKFAVAK